MTNAAQRLAALDTLPALELCRLALETLEALAAMMNEETTLLRAGRVKQATALTADKTRLAQDYTSLARAVQRQAARLKAEAPDAAALLAGGHERLATQIAENLKVIAVARDVTESVLADVAVAVNAGARPRTYGANGQIPSAPVSGARGVAVNRAL